MKDLIKSLCIRRSEAGEDLAHIHVTQEANGCAVWYQARGADPKLLAWAGFSPRTDTLGVIAAAQVHAQRIARDAVDHGEQFAARRPFVQL